MTRSPPFASRFADTVLQQAIPAFVSKKTRFCDFEFWGVWGSAGGEILSAGGRKLWPAGFSMLAVVHPIALTTHHGTLYPFGAFTTLTRGCGRPVAGDLTGRPDSENTTAPFCTTVAPGGPFALVTPNVHRYELHSRRHDRVASAHREPNWPVGGVGGVGGPI